MQFIQNLFGKLSATKPVEAFAWLKALKGMDDISAIKLCCDELQTEVQKDTVQNDEHYLSQLLALDEKTHIIVERITLHYVNIDNINTELEERMENTVFLYHRQIFLIYMRQIENLAETNHESLSVMLSRAMYSATQMIKWRYYNYQSAPANVWLQLAALYKVAAKHALLSTPVERYQDHAPETISTTYITACMLGSLESLSLKCQQIDLVHNMLKAWTEKTKIESVYDEKRHLFYIDTASNVAAKRIRNFTPANTYLYWSLDDCNINIELCLSLIEFNIVPKQQTVKDIIKNSYALSTLEVLRAEWSRIDYKRQRRSEERVKTVKSATTAYGFEDVCYQLKQYENPQSQLRKSQPPSESTLDERLATRQSTRNYHDPNIIYMDFGAGSSHIVDESNKGLGLRISKRANEVSLGMMVCVTVKEQKNETKIGVIRSIRPIAGGEVHIGIELFSGHAARVEVKNMSLNALPANAGNTSLNMSSPAHFVCLYLPKQSNVSIQDTLVFPKIHYNRNELYRVNILGEEHVIKTTEILEQREDWVRLTYSPQS